ncbi:MAG: hypothetical protein ACI4PE_03555 [Bacilli bacterium]
MVIQDPLNVADKLSKDEMLQVVGGVKISGTVVNAFTSAFKVLYGFGQEFGSALRRIIKKRLCSL